MEVSAVLGRLYGGLLHNQHDEQNQLIPKVQPKAVTEEASPPLPQVSPHIHLRWFAFPGC